MKNTIKYIPIFAALAFSSCNDKSESGNSQNGSSQSTTENVNPNSPKNVKGKIVDYLEVGTTYHGAMKVPADVAIHNRFKTRKIPVKKFDFTVLSITDDEIYTISVTNHVRTEAEQKKLVPAIYKGTFTSSGKLVISMVKTGVGLKGQDFPIIESDLKKYKVKMNLTVITAKDLLDKEQTYLNVFGSISHPYGGENFEIPGLRARKTPLIPEKP